MAPAATAGIGRREPVVRPQPTAAEGRRRGLRGVGALPGAATTDAAAAASEAGQALLRRNGDLIECVISGDGVPPIRDEHQGSLHAGFSMMQYNLADLPRCLEVHPEIKHHTW